MFDDGRTNHQQQCATYLSLELCGLGVAVSDHLVGRGTPHGPSFLNLGVSHKVCEKGVSKWTSENNLDENIYKSTNVNYLLKMKYTVI